MTLPDPTKHSRKVVKQQVAAQEETSSLADKILGEEDFILFPLEFQGLETCCDVLVRELKEKLKQLQIKIEHQTEVKIHPDTLEATLDQFDSVNELLEKLPTRVRNCNKKLHETKQQRLDRFRKRQAKDKDCTTNAEPSQHSGGLGRVQSSS